MKADDPRVTEEAGWVRDPSNPTPQMLEDLVWDLKAGEWVRD